MTDYIIASDGLPALPVKQHTLEKLNAIGRYIEQFATSMKPTGRATGFRGFQERNYIDLFSGPGLCVIEGIEQEIPGSPILALLCKYPLTNYYFVDINPDYIAALKGRADALNRTEVVSRRYFVGDCNEQISQILRCINTRYSINLAVIDGFSIECKWATIQALASCYRMDLIILFPQGMSINRNLKKWAEAVSNPLDAFFGTDKWKYIYESAGGKASKCIRPFLDLYQNNLKRLGYSKAGQIHEFLVRSKRGQKLYYLIFASRNPLGDHFWTQATSKSAGGQMKLFD